MAFTPDGDALWIVSRGSLEIRAWPSLGLIASAPFSTTKPVGLQCLAFHPAGRVAALGHSGSVRFLGMDGTPLERPAISTVEKSQLDAAVLALAFDEQGRLLVARGSGVRAVLPDGSQAGVGEPPAEWLPSWIWRAAILPASKQVAYCINDRSAAIFGWSDGRVPRDDEWAPGLFEDDHTSWLGADVAPGERALVCGRKSGRTWVVHLRAGVPVRTVLVEKALSRRTDLSKKPSRTTAHAIHPTDDALVYAEISGLVGHAKLSTGELVRELPSHSGGYAWE